MPELINLSQAKDFYARQARLTVCIVVFFDLPKSEGQLPHPVHPAPHSGAEVHLVSRPRGPEPVGMEVVVGEVLAVVVAGHVVNVHLWREVRVKTCSKEGTPIKMSVPTATESLPRLILFFKNQICNQEARLTDSLLSERTNDILSLNDLWQLHMESDKLGAEIENKGGERKS